MLASFDFTTPVAFVFCVYGLNVMVRAAKRNPDKTMRAASFLWSLFRR